jgi:hypothetical protein
MTGMVISYVAVQWQEIVDKGKASASAPRIIASLNQAISMMRQVM